MREHNLQTTIIPWNCLVLQNVQNLPEVSRKRFHILPGCVSENEDWTDIRKVEISNYSIGQELVGVIEVPQDLTHGTIIQGTSLYLDQKDMLLLFGYSNKINICYRLQSLKQLIVSMPRLNSGVKRSRSKEHFTSWLNYSSLVVNSVPKQKNKCVDTIFGNLFLLGEETFKEASNLPAQFFRISVVSVYSIF